MKIRWVLGAVLLCLLSSCASQRETWKMVFAASPEAIDAALESDPDFPYAWDAAKSSVPGIDPPIHLRPCCAFGMDMKTSYRGIPIPGVKVANIVDPENLGLHTYDAGLVGHGTDKGEKRSLEENGVVYSCRGGFIDVAHVRDYSDWTIYMGFWIYRNLGEHLELELPPELGPRKVIIRAFDSSGLDRQQELVLAATMAQWAAYKLSLWHEIAQWQGFGLKAFPEYPSAYSLEDLYSNILGTKIAVAIMYSGGSKTDQLYARNFDHWLENTLQHLGVLPVEGTRAYMAAVDQHWWDSNERLPNKYVVLRRNYDLGNVQAPTILPANLLQAVPAPHRLACADAEPINMEIVERIYGYPMEDIISLEIEIDDEFADVFSFPDEESAETRRVTDRQFSAIAEVAGAADHEELRLMGRK